MPCRAVLLSDECLKCSHELVKTYVFRVSYWLGSFARSKRGGVIINVNKMKTDLFGRDVNTLGNPF